jgi:CRP/FNR family cyclic AMP-dependent transcriptional regulator
MFRIGGRRSITASLDRSICRADCHSCLSVDSLNHRTHKIAGVAVSVRPDATSALRHFGITGRAAGMCEVNMICSSAPSPSVPRADGSDGDSSAFRDVLDRLDQREDVLGNLAPKDRDDLIKHGTVRKYRNGEPIFLQGTIHRNTYFILRGVVRTSYISHNSKEYTVAYWSTGDLVGGPYFINDNTTYLWSGYANEPTEVLAIPGNRLRELALRTPSLAVAMLDAMSFKIHWFSLLLQVMGTQSVEGRLGILLLGLSTAYGAETEDGLLIRYAFTQSDLAKMIGVSRQWVNNALGHFQRKGALSIVKGRFLIRNKAALKESLGPVD